MKRFLALAMSLRSQKKGEDVAEEIQSFQNEEL